MPSEPTDKDKAFLSFLRTRVHANTDAYVKQTGIVVNKY